MKKHLFFYIHFGKFSISIYDDNIYREMYEFLFSIVEISVILLVSLYMEYLIVYILDMECRIHHYTMMRNNKLTIIYRTYILILLDHIPINV